MTTNYPAYKGSSQSIKEALESLGIDSSYGNRKKIAEINGISNYEGKAEQNIDLLNKLKQGKLIKSKGSNASSSNGNTNVDYHQMLTNIQDSKEFDKKTHAMVVIGENLFENGYETSFVAGILANIYHEGNFGYFESSKYSSHPENKPKYLKIMDETYDYANKYSGKCVTDVSLKDLKTLCDKLDKDKWAKGKFGLGIIQWTGDRTGTLVNQYLEEANNADKISMDQVIKAEGKMVMKELQNKYKYIYSEWKEKNADLNTEEAAKDAGARICRKYEVPVDTEKQAEKRGNTAKKVYKIMVSK